MPPFIAFNPTATYALRFALLGVAYALAGYIGLSLIHPAGAGASIVWPMAAVGLTGLLFWGRDLWPALTISFFFLLLFIEGYSPGVAAVASMGNTLEALIGASILLRVGFHPLMSRLRDSLGLILAAFVSTFISASVIATSSALVLGRPFNDEVWAGLWIGHAVSILTFGAFVIRWGYRPLFTKTTREILVGLAIFGSITSVTYLLTWTTYTNIGPVNLIYLLVIPLIWASLRSGPRGITLALLIITSLMTSGVLFGPHAAGNSAQALFGAQIVVGTLAIIFLLFTSITEERKEAIIALEGHVGQLQNALEKISREDQAKSEFLAILAHELRNPLSPVLSGLEILKTKEHGPKDVLNMMGAHLNTLARLLDDLLDMTRISQKKFKLERELTSLTQIIERSLEMVQPYFTSKEHVFEKHMPKEELWIDADPVRITQVFVNLLNNAAKYTPPKGAITLTVERNRNEMVARVRDNGQGISPERAKIIFEPFAGGTPRNTTPGGLHIGLSLARRLVELHHGSIEMRSEGAGKGSEFVVRLPLAQKDEAVQPEVKKRSRGRFSKQAVADYIKITSALDVLVVDDNEAAARMLCTLLEHSGHKASVAHTGREALEIATKTRPQAVLLDIGLPDISGYEVGQRLREELPSVLLVALTGYGLEEDREKTRQAGFDDHLVKPVSIIDVEHALAHLSSTRS